MRTLIIGNSGSGKTTLGRRLARHEAAKFLSLDAIAFEEGSNRRPLEHSRARGLAFLRSHPRAVLEGCYADIGAALAGELDRLVFLNPGTEACISHCRARPWEPDKYPNRQSQDAMLAALIDWVSTYAERDDEYGLAAHRRLFDTFRGAKVELAEPARYEEEVIELIQARIGQ